MTKRIAEKRKNMQVKKCPMLKRKLTRNVEKEKTKGNKCGKHENEEEKCKSLQIINKLTSAEKSEGEC